MLILYVCIHEQRLGIHQEYSTHVNAATARSGENGAYVCLGPWPAYFTWECPFFVCDFTRISPYCVLCVWCWRWFPPFSMRCIHFRLTTFAVSLFACAVVDAVCLCTDRFYFSFFLEMDLARNMLRIVNCVPFGVVGFYLFIFRLLWVVSTNRILFANCTQFESILMRFAGRPKRTVCV